MKKEVVFIRVEGFNTLCLPCRRHFWGVLKVLNPEYNHQSRTNIPRRILDTRSAARLLISFLLIQCLMLGCTPVDEELDFNLLFQNTPLNFETLNIYATKYVGHDEDHEKLNRHTLFSDRPELSVVEPNRIYFQVRTIEQGGRLADVFYKMRYKKIFSRKQIEYKNMYIYYYYQKNIRDWTYVIIISKHTGEMLCYLDSGYGSPNL